MPDPPKHTPFQAEILELRTRVIGLTSNISSKTAWSGGGWHRASEREVIAMKADLATVRARLRTLLTGVRREELDALATVLASDNHGDLAWLQRQAKKR